MALKVKAVERKIKFTKDENDPGVWRYVMQPDLQKKAEERWGADVVEQVSLDL